MRPPPAAWFVALALACGAAGQGTPQANGGPNKEDWRDLYPGCQKAVLAAQEFKETGSLEPKCARDYEACIEQVYRATESHEMSYEWEGKRNEALCRCLADHRFCVKTRVALEKNYDNSPTAPAGCPEIVYSRVCEQLEADLVDNTLFPEETSWSCTACVGEGDADYTCIKALRTDVPCDCFFKCPDGYDLDCAGYKCHSITCLLTILGCWVSTGGCSKVDAWDLCLYDSPVITRDGDTGQWVVTERKLGCSIDRCREVITNLVDETGGQWPMWLVMYFAIFFGGYGTLYLVRRMGEKKRRQQLLKYQLSSPIAGASTLDSRNHKQRAAKKS